MVQQFLGENSRWPDGRKKVSKASKQAAAALKGREVTPEQDVQFTRSDRPAGSRRWDWLNKPMLPFMRLTWKAVLLFLLFCLILDVILYLIVQVGLGNCYGLLCLL